MKKAVIVSVTVGLLTAACSGATDPKDYGPPAETEIPPSASATMNSDQTGPALGASLHGDGSKPGSDTTTDPTGVSTQALSAAQCDQVASCNNDGARNVIMFYGGRDECIAHFEKENQLRIWRTDLLIQQSQIDACAQALSAPGACGTFRSYAECNFTGHVEIAGGCGDNAQCRTGNCSAKEGQCGVCEPDYEVGDDCSGEALGCGAGLYCNEGTKKCAVRPKLGESCSGGYFAWGCQDGLACIDGTCAPRIAEGNACNMNATALGVPVCAPGLGCFDSVCKKSPDYKKVSAGGTCPAEGTGKTCAASLCDDTVHCKAFAFPDPPAICD